MIPECVLGIPIRTTAKFAVRTRRRDRAESRQFEKTLRFRSVRLCIAAHR